MDAFWRLHFIEPITINGDEVSQVQISLYYEKKHKPPMTDALILKCVQVLDGAELEGQECGSQTFFTVRINIARKWYRLIWFFQDGDKGTLYVRNCFPDSKPKGGKT